MGVLKPGTLPQWATTGGTTVEPSGGQKAAGFAVGTKPPARWVNWLFNNLYTWIQYIDAPQGSAGTTGGDAFTGTGGTGSGGTGGAGLAGVGGATNGIGVKGTGSGTGPGILGLGAGTPVTATSTTGSGVVGKGGQTNGFGGEFFGKGSGAGAVGTGGSSSGAPGLSGIGGSSNGIGVLGTGVGTGIGVKGVGINGYGVWAESDTTSPTSAALHIVPQDATPSSPLAGDIWINSVSGLLRGYKAGSENVRYVGRVQGITSAVTQSISTDSSAVISSYTIPAGTLKAGTTIRIQASGKATDVSGAPDILLRLGGSSDGVSIAFTNSTNRFKIDAIWTVRTVGASGVVAYANAYDALNNTTYTRKFSNSTFTSMDTTGALNIDVYGEAGEGGGAIQLDQFNVDISD